MNNNNTMDLITVRQLPVIEEQLRMLHDRIKAETEEALRLACTEDTLAAVKSRRAELNKLYGELEARRKAVKAEVLAPYQAFELVYRETVTEPFTAADAALKGKIAAVEDEIKGRCEEKLDAYWRELIASYGLEWLRREDCPVKVDMASARQLEPRKLMALMQAYVDGIAADVNYIRGTDNADEVLAEYKGCRNLTQALTTVSERHKAIAAASADMEAAQVDAPEPPVSQDDAMWGAPKHITNAVEERLTLTFAVTDTLPRLRQLKAWLVANNYDVADATADK